MSLPQQEFETILPDQLVARAAGLKAGGWRLSCISTARLGACVEVIYSFDLDYRMLNLRLELPLESPRLPSISQVYWCSVLYENEMHDLFDINVEGMAVDFKGNLYRTAVKFPFGTTRPPKTPEAGPVPSAANEQLSTRK